MSRDARPKKSSPVATAKDFLTGADSVAGDGDDRSVPEVGEGSGLGLELELERKVRVRGGVREGRVYLWVRLGLGLGEEKKEW